MSFWRLRRQTALWSVLEISESRRGGSHESFTLTDREHLT